MATSVKIALCLAVGLLAPSARAQNVPDERAVRQIIQEQVAAWNKGDAEAYARHFSVDGTFTNSFGMFFTGHDVFRERYARTLSGILRGSVKQEEIVSLRFIRPDVAIVETLESITGFQKLPTRSPSLSTDEKGRIRMRNLQVLVKDGREWKIVVYHNVDVKPGVSVPEPAPLMN